VKIYHGEFQISEVSTLSLYLASGISAEDDGRAHPAWTCGRAGMRTGGVELNLHPVRAGASRTFSDMLILSGGCATPRRRIMLPRYCVCSASAIFPSPLPSGAVCPPMARQPEGLRSGPRMLASDRSPRSLQNIMAVRTRIRQPATGTKSWMT